MFILEILFFLAGFYRTLLPRHVKACSVPNRMSKSLLKVVFLLVAALVLHSAALPLWWQWDLWCARKQAWSQIEQKTTVQLVISVQEFRDQRVGRRELWFQGALYDVRRYEVRADSVFIWAHRDRKEEHLYKQGERLFAALSAPSPTQDSPIQWVVRLISSAFLPPEGVVCWLPKLVESPSVSFELLAVSCACGYPQNLDPPPEPVLFQESHPMLSV